MKSETQKVPVAVAIVSHDSAGDLPGCLDTVAALAPGPREVIVVDCASRDGSPEVVRAWRDRHADRRLPLELVPLDENLGFAGGMNVAISHTESPHVLSLNPDARPAVEYLEHLVSRMERPLPGGSATELRVGAVTGRLLRPMPVATSPTSPSPERPRLLDACGMRLTPTWRHLDRGSGEPDRGQYPLPERVFGATGAASLFRREALLDVAVDGDVFDPFFHSFREDAELAFRLRERGWEILYEPRARCEHRRLNVPERRHRMSRQINRQSLKNRYLLRFYHQTAGNFWKTAIPTLARDLLALSWVLVAERSSLPAYRWLWRHRREVLARRRSIQSRRTTSPRELDRWFFIRGMPLEPPSSATGGSR